MTEDKRNNHVGKKGSEIIPQRRLPRLMSEICDLAINDLNAMFVNMLNEVEQSFFSLADQAESDKEQSLYFHSMTQIQNRRSNVELKFSERLAKAFIILLNTGYRLPLERTPLNLQDVEKSRITAIIDKANSDNQVQLLQVTNRIDLLLSNVRLTLSNNPVSPLSICNVFVETLALFELQIKAKLTLYTLFERLFISKINLVYKKMNIILVNNGVLPNLASVSSNENPSLFKEYPSMAVATISTIDINQLIKALTKIQATILSSTKEREEVERGELAKPSNKIRKHIENARLSSNINPGQLFDKKTNDIIACISMLFDFIVNDKNLPNEFKILINKLQVPLLKLGLMDGCFITKGNHPARILLNELAEAGVGWSRGGAVGLKDKVEDVVNNIINEFDYDIALFTHSLLDFQTFNVEHKKRAFLIERRLQEAELGKAKNETARLKASQAIEDIVGGKVLPKTLTQLIHEDWKNVMLLTYLRSGDDSQSWNNNIQTAKTLIDLLSLNEDIGVTVANRFSDIAENIKLGLNVINYGEYESVKLFEELQQLYEPPLELISSDNLEKRPSINSNILPDNEVFNYSDIPLPIVEEISSFEINEAEQNELTTESFVTMVESLKAGNWFELQLKDKKARCKLAAIITSINKYIFVDYTGKKIAEFSKPNLVKAFKEQRISQLDEGTLFKRAFKSTPESNSNNENSV
jgi:hypothetical protein